MEYVDLFDSADVAEITSNFSFNMRNSDCSSLYPNCLFQTNNHIGKVYIDEKASREIVDLMLKDIYN